MNNTTTLNEPTTYQSVSEASKYTTLSERTLRELITNGTIKAIRKGRRIILKQEELDRYLEGGDCNE